MNEAERIERRARDAATRFYGAVESLRYGHSETGNPERRWLYGYLAAELLRKVLSDAESLVGLLNDDAGDEAERAARAVHDALRARRLAAKLANVEGRTPEEAAAFLAKADALRGAEGDQP